MPIWTPPKTDEGIVESILAKAADLCSSLPQEDRALAVSTFLAGASFALLDVGWPGAANTLSRKALEAADIHREYRALLANGGTP